MKAIGDYFSGDTLDESNLYQLIKWQNSLHELDVALGTLRKYGTPCQIRCRRKNPSSKQQYAIFRLDDFEKKTWK